MPRRTSTRVALRAPIIVLVLAVTAVPVELRPFTVATVGLDSGLVDILANVALYVPVGWGLVDLGAGLAVTLAFLIAGLAETSQFFMMHRFPSPVDLAMNVLGASLGLLISRRWSISAPKIKINTRTTLWSVALAVALIGLKAWATPPDARHLSVNPRGAITPGTLEAHWKFDEGAGSVASDFSGNGLGGTLRGGATFAEGILGQAVWLASPNSHVNFGDPIALRLMGSMTVTAWINSSSFPIDDAPIVSAHSPGYQLDTTVDRGPRTLGFKLVDTCGNLMMRYGATPLALDTWYHVAGVYDADLRTLNVYLNGRRDDGFLSGPVRAAQQTSSLEAKVGLRGDSRRLGGTRFEFAGLIDDVRIYSRALSPTEVEAVMTGETIPERFPRQATSGVSARDVADVRLSEPGLACDERSDRGDALTPGLAATVGLLLALASLGLARSPTRSSLQLRCLIVSTGSGVLLIPGVALTLPSYDLWMIPLISLAGGVSVALSIQHRDGSTNKRSL